MAARDRSMSELAEGLMPPPQEAAGARITIAKARNTVKAVRERHTSVSFWKEERERAKSDDLTVCEVGTCDDQGQPFWAAPGAVHELMKGLQKEAKEKQEKECEPESASKTILLSFFFLGVGSEVLWGALMLSVGTIAQRYGPAAMSSMSSVQNNSWLWTMVFFTVIPRPASHRVTVALLAISILAMLALSVILARTLRVGPSALPPERHFAIAIGLNGICTGMAQILAAALSGLFSILNSAVPGALLLGVTAGPLALAAISLTLPALGASASETSFVTLSIACVLLGLALLGLALLSRAEQPPPVVTCGSCNSDGGKNKEYLCRRISEMAANSGLMLATLFFGILVLCSVPYGAAHVCRGDENCTANLPRLMVATCTISSFVGRFLASLDTSDRSLRTIGASVLLRAVFAGTLACSYAAGRFPDGAHGQMLAVACVAIVTIWGNGLVIGLSKESQRACGHSLLFPCPITAQITWISLQSGSLLGSLCSFFF